MEENDKSYSKLEWFFYIILLPLLFTLLLAGLLLAFLGNNVAETALNIGKKIPGISQLISSPETDEEATDALMTEENSEEKEPDAKDIEIDALQATVQDQKQEIAQLKEQLQTLEQVDTEKRLTDEERADKIRQLATVYEAMAPKKVAAIMENLTLREAALLLTSLPQHQQSDILSRLDPKRAAELTLVLKESDPAENPDIAALQERVNTFLDSLEGSKSTLSIDEMAKTFTSLPPAQAAKLLEEMSKSNQEFQLGLKILANLNDSARSAIFAQMQVDTAKRYVHSLLNS